MVERMAGGVSGRSAADARRWRALAWAGVPLLVLVRVAVTLTVADPTVRFLMSDTLTYIAPMALAAAMCTLLAALYRTTVEQRFWGLLAGACGMLLVSEVYWDWYVVSVDPIGPPFESGRMFFTVGAASLFFALLLTMTRLPGQQRARKARLLVDLFAAMVVAYGLVYASWTYPLMSGVADRVRVAAWTAGWPVFGMTMGFVIFATMAGYKAYRWRPWERLASVSHAVFALGLVGLPAYYRQVLGVGRWSSSWYNLVLGAGLYLLFVAAVYRLTSSDADALAQPWPLPRHRLGWLGHGYPVLLAVSLPVLGLLSVAFAPLGARGPLAGAALVLAVLLGVRSWLTVIEAAQHRTSAVSDALTGAYNASLLAERLDSVKEDSEGGGAVAGFLACRLDGFERLDEFFGRENAEAMLRRTVGLLRSQSPSSTDVFRIGAAEFLAILPGADVPVTLAVAERVCRGTAAGEGVDSPLPVFSVSCGISHAEEGSEWRPAIERARSSAKVASDTDERVHVHDSAEKRPSGVAGDGRTRALRAALLGIARAGESRFGSVAGHSERVSELAVALARQLELPDERVELVRVSALLHDLGQIGLRERLLPVQDRQSDQEREAIERHSELGETLLVAAGLREAGRVVRHHHERWDGQGYPDRLKGEQTPLESRIISACSTLDVMTNVRSGRTASSLAQSLAMIRDAAGSRFDPVVVDGLAALLESGEGVPLTFRGAQVIPIDEANAS